MKIDIEGTEEQKKEVREKEQVKEPKKEPKKEVREKEPKKEKKSDNREHPSIIKNFIGKEIAITLRNGNVIKGKLEAVAQYELVITTTYNPMIVMKHAIDYLEPKGEK